MLSTLRKRDILITTDWEALRLSKKEFKLMGTTNIPNDVSILRIVASKSKRYRED